MLVAVRRPARPAMLNMAALTVVVALLALSSAWVIGVLGPTAGGALAGMVLGTLMLTLPASALFWLLMAATFVIAGPVQYFGGVGRAFWIPYLLGALAAVKALLVSFSANRDSQNARSAPSLLRVLAAFGLALYLAAPLVGAFISATSPLQVILSLKEYYFLWGAGLLVAVTSLRTRGLDQLFAHSHVYLLLQLPVVIYQRFVVAVSRHGPSTWDSVVGLMAGDPEGGGASATMALLVTLIVAYHLAAWRAGRCGWFRLGLVFVVGLATILLAEVKLAIFLLPLACMLVYADGLVQRPFATIGVLALSLAVGLTVLITYQLQFSQARGAYRQSLGDYLQGVYERNSGAEQINFRTGEMGRVAAVRLWWDDSARSGPIPFVLGHGVGASRIGLVPGDIAQRYSFRIGRSSLTILLWEGGVVAITGLILALLAAAARGLLLANKVRDPAQGVLLRTSAVGLIATLIMLPYGPDFVTVAPAQLIAILMVITTLGVRLPPGDPVHPRSRDAWTRR